MPIKLTRLIFILAVTAMLPLSALTGSALATVSYTVEVNPDLKQAAVQACFSGDPDDPHLADLYLSGTARRAISRLRWNDQPVPDLRRWGGLQVSPDQQTGCLSYQVKLSSSSERWGYTSSAYMLTDPKHWLLSPPPGADAMVRFVLPDEVAVSHPWPRAETQPVQGSVWYRLGLTDPSWSSNVAFGRFAIHNIPIADTFLRLAVLPGTPLPDLNVTRQWVTESARAVLYSHGDLPQSEPQVLVMPIGRQREAIPFARVLRGGGVGLQFFIDPAQRLRDYRDDWKPTHEFSHLLLPYISRRDAWLSEGLASYYQNVMRARDGRLSEREAWDKLLAGFERGRDGVTSNRTLAEEASGMHRNQSYKRVYWSGAAMLFLADVELRKSTNGRHSLDTALAGVAACCMQLGKVWRAQDMMREMDRITGTDVFTSIYRRHTRSNRFPAVETVLNELGVSHRRGRVSLNDDASSAHLRGQIMRPVVPPSEPGG